MFTQKISMECTKEQYEKYLKDELLKMGYEEFIISKEGSWRDVIVTNYDKDNNKITDMYKKHSLYSGRTYLGSFNAPLFLALAAMTDKAEGNYGEYVIGKYSGDFYIVNDIFRRYINISNVRKATKEEIMAKFGEKKRNHNTLENKIDQLNENGQVEINIPFNKPKIESGVGVLIEELMNTIEKAHIDALKSRGYKILKPKTWEEI